MIKIENLLQYNGFYKTNEAREVVFNLYKGKCNSCNTEITSNVYDIGHIVPQEHAIFFENMFPGLDVHNLLNLQLQHEHCNRKLGCFFVAEPLFLHSVFSYVARLIEQRLPKINFGKTSSKSKLIDFRPWLDPLPDFNDPEFIDMNFEELNYDYNLDFIKEISNRFQMALKYGKPIANYSDCIITPMYLSEKSDPVYESAIIFDVLNELNQATGFHYEYPKIASRIGWPRHGYIDNAKWTRSTWGFLQDFDHKKKSKYLIDSMVNHSLELFNTDACLIVSKADLKTCASGVYRIACKIKEQLQMGVKPLNILSNIEKTTINAKPLYKIQKL